VPGEEARDEELFPIGRVPAMGRRSRNGAIQSMDRATLLDHIERTKRNVADGEAHITRQTELIARLKRYGHSTGTAVQILKTFEQVQRARLASLEKDLEKLDQFRR
jgi:hypothetical protein